MGDAAEQQRLKNLYEQLRLKLLDLSKKNPMLNYRLGARSKRHLQIVDEVLEEAYRKLVGEDTALKIAFLQEPDDIPPEERTEDFLSALEYAMVSDIEYLSQNMSGDPEQEYFADGMVEDIITSVDADFPQVGPPRRPPELLRMALSCATEG